MCNNLSYNQKKYACVHIYNFFFSFRFVLSGYLLEFKITRQLPLKEKKNNNVSLSYKKIYNKI